MKVLHVASFFGNIGDNANHAGMRRMLAQNISRKIHYTELEIRRFYQNCRPADRLRFDEDFARLCNSHDLVLIGGGNFLEPRFPNSTTGTTIDISPEILDRIETTVVLNGVGFDPAKGVDIGSLDRMTIFLKRLLDDPRHLVSVRNDGSLHDLKNELGAEIALRVWEIPDGGFFIDPSSHEVHEISETRLNIAVNIVADMPEVRFAAEGKRWEDGYSQYLRDVAHCIDGILSAHSDVHFVLVPHIYSDLAAIAAVLDLLDDAHRRSRVSVSAYVQGPAGSDYIFDVYRRCVAVLGCRFHANVCAIGMEVPSIGVVTYPKIEKLYKGLGLEGATLEACAPDFGVRLGETMERLLDGRERTRIQKAYAAIRERLSLQLAEFHSELLKVLSA